MQLHPAAAVAAFLLLHPFEVVMPCACAQRRVAIIEALKAGRSGDVAGAGAKLAFVAQSATVDARMLAARSLAAARARLAR